MERLTTVGGSFAAHVLEARLRFEGIEVQLRGSVDGPYQFTVGAMSTVDVFVPEHDLDDARLLLLVDDVESAFQRDGGRSSEHSTRLYWVALLIIVVSGVLPILRLALGA